MRTRGPGPRTQDPVPRTRGSGSTTQDLGPGPRETETREPGHSIQGPRSSKSFRNKINFRNIPKKQEEHPLKQQYVIRSHQNRMFFSYDYTRYRNISNPLTITNLVYSIWNYYQLCTTKYSTTKLTGCRNMYPLMFEN